MKKRKYEGMLFTVFETQIEVCRVKPKEKILLNNCVIDYEESYRDSAMTDANKFKFKILVPKGDKSVDKGGKYTTHILGCNSEELRKEWIFCLQIIRSYEGKFSMRSSLNYLNQ